MSDTTSTANKHTNKEFLTWDELSQRFREAMSEVTPDFIVVFDKYEEEFGTGIAIAVICGVMSSSETGTQRMLGLASSALLKLQSKVYGYSAPVLMTCIEDIANEIHAKDEEDRKPAKFDDDGVHSCDIDKCILNGLTKDEADHIYNALHSEGIEYVTIALRFKQFMKKYGVPKYSETTDDGRQAVIAFDSEGVPLDVAAENAELIQDFYSMRDYLGAGLIDPAVGL